MQKWGRSSPFRSLARVQNQHPSKTQPQCSLQCPFTEEVNGTLNRRVNGVFHAPFTFPRQKRALNFIGILAPLRPAPGEFSGFHRFLTSPGIFGPPTSIEATRHQRELPPYTKRPSKQENLTENLCDLPFFFRGPTHSEAPSSSSMGYDLRMRRSPSRTANSDRGALK